MNRLPHTPSPYFFLLITPTPVNSLHSSGQLCLYSCAIYTYVILFSCIKAINHKGGASEYEICLWRGFRFCWLQSSPVASIFLQVWYRCSCGRVVKHPLVHTQFLCLHLHCRTSSVLPWLSHGARTPPLSIPCCDGWEQASPRLRSLTTLCWQLSVAHFSRSISESVIAWHDWLELAEIINYFGRLKSLLYPVF